MLKVSSWKKLHGLAGAAALAGALVATGAARPAGAQPACYQRSGYLMDTCGNPGASQADYEFRYANGGYFAFADGTNYLVFCKANDLTIFNVGNPFTPTSLASAHIPWDWNTIDTGSDTHGPYVNHIKQVATAGGFRYAIVPLGDYGWDFLRISGPGAKGFLGTGFHPARKLDSSDYMSAAVFSDGNSTFAAAQKLDQGSIASNDSSIQIYRIGTDTDLTPGLSSANMQPLARVPTDASFNPTMSRMRFWVANVGGRQLLFALRRLVQPAVLIVDVTTPGNPQIVNTIQGDPQLFGGEWTVDEGHSMVWVADPSHPIVHGYKIVQTPPLNIPQLEPQYSVTWWGTGTEAVSGTTLSVEGNLLVAASLTKVGYLSLAGGQPTPLPRPVMPFTDLYGRVCSNPNFGESVNKLCVFQVSGQHYVLRSMIVSADIVGVNGSCISTVPLPDFTVTGGSASATCADGTAYDQADAGFPGDTFTIKDASAGVWDTATLEIKDPQGTTVQSSQFTDYGQEVTWTPATNAAPGDYTVTLSITGGDPPFRTKVISLCSDPKAVLTVAVAGVNCSNPAAGCTALVNDTVSLGDTGTQGAPSGAPIYLYQQVNGPVSQGSTFQPANGNYNVGVVVPYAFSAAPDTTCTNNTLFSGYVPGGAYASCAIGTVQAGYGTASFQVEQPAGTSVAWDGHPGTVQVDNTVVLRFTGRIASGYTPNFTWSGIGMVGSPTCVYSAGTNGDYNGSTCTIPGGKLTAGPQQTWGLSVDVCNGGGLGVPCTTTVQTSHAPVVNVTPTQNSISFSATPPSGNIGQTITVTLGQMIPATGYSSLRIDFGGMSCDGEPDATVTCRNPFGQYICGQGSQVKTFSYAAAGTKNVTITGTLSGGGTVQSASLPITVGTSGTCPCPTVSPTISGPSSASVGQNVSFSENASPPPGHSITSWSWTFGDGDTATGQSVSHSWNSSGRYQVRVTATSDCGTTGIDTNTIDIGGGGGGNFTITPSPATVDPGATVTFTFSPAVNRVGDSVTFNFGDGHTQTMVYAGICQALGGCNKVTHNYVEPRTYTVSGGGTAGGMSVSGSTTVTVRNTCTLPSAPTAAFTWLPSVVRVGEVVQFGDASTGGPTAWSWNFGGPGVSGSTSAQSFATTLAALTITPNDATPNAGQQVVFTFSPGVGQSGDQVTFDFGDGSATQAVTYLSMFCSTANPCSTINHTFSQSGTYTVSASGTAGGASVSGSTQVVVSGGGGGTFTITASPSSATVGQNVTFVFSPTVSTSGDSLTVSFGDGQQGSVSYPCTLGACGVVHAYSAADTYTVSASGTVGGASVSGSTTVVIGGGGGWGGTSTLQNPTFTYTSAGTYTVTLAATNCKGSNQTAQQIVVLGPCTQTGPPVADFDWGPTGTLAGYPEQQQPYAGQQVTLTDRSTNEPDTWHWYDFQEGAVDQTVTTSTFSYIWTQPGDKSVRMTAHNCSGQWSSEVLKTVHIYEDVRHVTADFSWSPSDVSTEAQVTFTAAQGETYGEPAEFAWTFDDGSTQTGASVTYSFKCAGSRRVTLTAARGGTTGTVTKSVAVTGTSCGPESVMGVDAAKIQGLNDTNWRADVRIYNPSAFPTSITLQFLPVGTNNVDPFTVGPYQPPLPPRGTLVLDDILQWVKLNFGQDFSKTALRFTYQNDDNVPPIVTIRTYNLRPDGSKYGQINPGVNVVPGTTPAVLWITGLRNNGLTDGFRTNYSIVNLRGDPGGIGGIAFTLFDEAGAPLGSKTFGLAPFGYIQDSIKNLFGPSFENIGTFSLKVEVPTGGDVQVYASVMDNHTGDPVLIPATALPGSPIYLPAMAHLAGEASTVWRTDLQLTNPDTDAPHTWEIRYTPKGTGLSVIARSITLAPDTSSFIDDLVSWVYADSATPLPADAQTSGIVRIAPVDGTNVYPAVAARSYNLTAIGTFGQGIPALSAARGVSFPDPTRLVLTGMSSEDIARTNLGFVNLSETQGVNFVVSFYDDRGNILNPPGTDGQPQPYTFAIGPGTWDQDKLENRFRNAFKVALPATLQAVTAEIRVSDGGPGFAYASVIDNMTGDPNFIPAQLAP